MATVDWTDGIGAATLGNAFIYPGNRFANWNPKNIPVGARSHTLETGALNTTAFRDDLTVALDITGIPNTDMAKMLRLQMHLKRSGVVTLDTEPDSTIPTFGDCKLAPGADVQIQLTDKAMLEYTVSTVLRGHNYAAPAVGGTEDEGCVLVSDEDVIPFNYAAHHKDALYFQDFAYDTEAEWRATFRDSVIDYDAGYEYIEHASVDYTLDYDRKFNCHASLKCVDAAAGGELSSHAHFGFITVEKPDLSHNYIRRLWGRIAIWVDPTIDTDENDDIGFSLFGVESSKREFNQEYLNRNDTGSGYLEDWRFGGDFDADGKVHEDFAEFSGQWAFFSFLNEGDPDGTPGRFRAWKEDGTELLDEPTSDNITEDDDISAYAFLKMFVTGTSDHFYNVGLLEFVDGGTEASPINPYSGLEGI